MRTWHLKMACTYEGPQNHIATMHVEQQDDTGAWKPLEITNRSPGFLTFVFSILTCQHLYFYTNAAENGLEAAESEGLFTLVATQDWMLESLDVAYTVRLRSGTATPEQTADIQGRMNRCPVSRNLHPNGAHTTSLRFVA